MPEKKDAGKTRYSLLPEGWQVVIKSFEAGLLKYQEDDWKLVERPLTRYFDSTMRHMWAWWEGENIDPDSGVPHLACAAASIFILIWHSDRSGPHG